MRTYRYNIKIKQWDSHKTFIYSYKTCKIKRRSGTYDLPGMYNAIYNNLLNPSNAAEFSEFIGRVDGFSLLKQHFPDVSTVNVAAIGKG